MELSEIQDIILKLKAVRNSDPDQYTIKKMQKALDEQKTPVSESVLRRVFAENSETDDSFSYKSIKPIAELLIKEEPEQATSTQHIAVAHAKIDLLLTIIDGKNGIIERQSDKIGKLTAQVEKLVEQMQTIREMDDARIDFLRNQIEKKDRRMDEKDEIIKMLLVKVLKEDDYGKSQDLQKV